MSDKYLNLPLKEQDKILREKEKKIGKPPLILQKDIWVCWALEQLFNMPGRLRMAFKGGTSLSKVYKAIHRFSEDIDISMDYRDFCKRDLISTEINRKQKDKICEDIRSQVVDHIKNIIFPYFEVIIARQFSDNPPEVELDQNGETINIHYPSAVSEKSSYISDSIRLEFGGRNQTEPNNTHTIIPEAAENITDLEFPKAQIIVLSPSKTFWEKLTLIHKECNRSEIRHDANRIFRHWYDISMLAKNDIGKEALKDDFLLKDIIKIMKIFWPADYAKYDDCLVGKIRLIPNEENLKLLREDFNKMRDEGMFYGEMPVFDEIIESIKKLESKINNNLKI